MPEKKDAAKPTRYKLKEVCIRLAEGHPLYSDWPIDSPGEAIKVMRGELSRYDREVLTAAGLNSGTVTEGALFLQTVREKIILAGKRETICGDCQWTSLCTLEQMI